MSNSKMTTFRGSEGHITSTRNGMKFDFQSATVTLNEPAMGRKSWDARIEGYPSLNFETSAEVDLNLYTDDQRSVSGKALITKMTISSELSNNFILLKGNGALIVEEKK